MSLEMKNNTIVFGKDIFQRSVEKKNITPMVTNVTIRVVIDHCCDVHEKMKNQRMTTKTLSKLAYGNSVDNFSILYIYNLNNSLIRPTIISIIINISNHLYLKISKLNQ